MSLSKVNETVTITPYNSTEIYFELFRVYRTPSLNVGATNVFQLKLFSNAFNNLRQIRFPNIADVKIDALLGVNAFTFTYFNHVTQGNQNQLLGV